MNHSPSATLTSSLAALDKLVRGGATEISWAALADTLPAQTPEQTRALVRFAAAAGLIEGYHEQADGFSLRDLSEAGLKPLVDSGSQLFWKMRNFIFFVLSVLLLNTLGL